MLVNETLNQKKIILASGSPRRKELLGSIVSDFEVRVTDVDEQFPEHLAAEEVPLFLAKLKAEAIFPSLKSEEIAITADTVVVLNGIIMNKPYDASDARWMLEQLSGARHQVITACGIVSIQQQQYFSDKVDVVFRSLRSEEIEFYIDHFKPFDKAGAYGIQEWIGMVGIERIEGSFYTVMGLPVHLVHNALINYK
jgi:septum formation protein